MFRINETTWYLRLVEPHSDMLRRSDGTITLGVTDASTHTVYINRRLHGRMLDKVLCHEITHCFSFAYNLNIPVETEEIIADFLATYGRDIFAVADDILSRFMRIA